jgi:hypothetical protein
MYDSMKKELLQDEIYKRQKTLCFDIQSVFIRKVNILDYEELSNIKKIPF